MLVGILLIILGCLSSSIGLLLMKRSTDVEETLPFHKRWRWMGGFVFLVVNATIIDLFAYAITPLSLIAPFAGLTMVFTLILARFGLVSGVEEPLSRSQVIATVLVVVGVTIVSVAQARPASDEPGMAELLGFFYNPTFVVFATLTLSTVAIYLALLSWPPLRHWRPPTDTCASTVLSAYCASVCGAESQLFLKVVSVGLHEAGGLGDPGAVAQPAFLLSLLGLVRLAHITFSPR